MLVSHCHLLLTQHTLNQFHTMPTSLAVYKVRTGRSILRKMYCALHQGQETGSTKHSASCAATITTHDALCFVGPVCCHSTVSSSRGQLGHDICDACWPQPQPLHSAANCAWQRLCCDALLCDGKHECAGHVNSWHGSERQWLSQSLTPCRLADC